MQETVGEGTAAKVLDALTGAFVERYRELLEGVPDGRPTWVTTGGREGGAYGTLADVTAAEASRDVYGISIAAHAYHLRWAIDLVNRYFAGHAAYHLGALRQLKKAVRSG